MCKLGFRILFVTGFLILVRAAGVSADTCVTFVTVPQGAGLTLFGPRLVSAQSPGTFCSLDPGKTYRLGVDLAGYESRRMKFKVSSDNRIKTSSDSYNYLWRSVFIPGLGQYQAGDKGSGVWMFVMTAPLVYDMVNIYYDWQDAQNAADVYAAALELATQQSVIEQLSLYSYKANLQADAYKNRLYETLALTGYLYTYNLVETMLFTQAPSIKANDGSTVTVETPRISRWRVLARSAIYPGLGQKYVGSGNKGTLFELGFIGCGYWMVEERYNYEIADTEYQAALFALQNATTVDEISTARQDVERTYNNLQNQERERNAAYIATGALWLINMVDATFLQLPSAAATSFTIKTSWVNGGVRTTLGFRF